MAQVFEEMDPELAMELLYENLGGIGMVHDVSISWDKKGTVTTVHGEEANLEFRAFTLGDEEDSTVQMGELLNECGIMVNFSDIHDPRPEEGTVRFE